MTVDMQLPAHLLELCLLFLSSTNSSLFVDGIFLVCIDWFRLCTEVRQKVWEQRQERLQHARAQAALSRAQLDPGAAHQLDEALKQTLELCVTQLEGYCVDSTPDSCPAIRPVRLRELDGVRRLYTLLQQGAGTACCRNYAQSTEFNNIPLGEGKNCASLFERMIRLVEEAATESEASAARLASDSVELIEALTIAPGDACTKNAFGIIQDELYGHFHEISYGTAAAMARRLLASGHLYKSESAGCWVSQLPDSTLGFPWRSEPSFAPRSVAALQLVGLIIELDRLLDQSDKGDGATEPADPRSGCVPTAVTHMAYPSLKVMELCMAPFCTTALPSRLQRMRAEAIALFIHTSTSTDAESFRMDLHAAVGHSCRDRRSDVVPRSFLPLDIFALLDLAARLLSVASHAEDRATTLERFIVGSGFTKVPVRGGASVDQLTYCLIQTYFNNDQSALRLFKQRWQHSSPVKRKALLECAPDLMGELCRRRNSRAVGVFCQSGDNCWATSDLLSCASRQRGLVHRIVEMILLSGRYSVRDVVAALLCARKVNNHKTLGVLECWLEFTVSLVCSSWRSTVVFNALLSTLVHASASKPVHHLWST